MENVRAQQHVECAHCKRNALHYCNTCGEAICGRCKNRHSKRLKNHQIVLYKDRQNPSLIAEKCSIHPETVYIMCCENCDVPVCTNCIKDDHRGHVFEDLFDTFSLKQDQCNHHIHMIKHETLPQSRALLADVTNDFKVAKKEFDDIRSSMNSVAQNLKDKVDYILNEKLKEVNEIEECNIATLKGQEHDLTSHILYLENMVSEYERIVALKKPTQFITFHNEHITDIKKLPEFDHINFPSFISSEVDMTDLTDPFGKVVKSYVEPLRRKVQELKLKDTDNSLANSKTPSVEFFSTIKQVPNVVRTRHMSCQDEGKVWVSDDRGNLVLVDIQGNKLAQVGVDIYADNGLHTVTQSRELLVVDEVKHVINKVIDNKKTKVVIKTGEWFPKCVYFCPTSSNIVVGLQQQISVQEGEFLRVVAEFGMVAQYNKSYEKLLEIRADGKGNDLYGCPYFISMNINGDICTSDFVKQSVIVIDKRGRHRFSYSGQASEPQFYPSGLCPDSWGNLLILNAGNRTVHLIDKDGNFISVLLELPWDTADMRAVFNPLGPLGLCLDANNNLWVGEYVAGTIRIYKYCN